jgi:hypothetical protein
MKTMAALQDVQHLRWLHTDRASVSMDQTDSFNDQTTPGSSINPCTNQVVAVFPFDFLPIRGNLHATGCIDPMETVLALPKAYGDRNNVVGGIAVWADKRSPVDF